MTTQMTIARPARTSFTFGQILRMDGALLVASGAVALAVAPTIADLLDGTAVSVRIVGAILAVLGIDALLAASTPPRWSVRVATVFGATREVVLAGALIVALRDGFGWPVLVLSALLAESVVLGFVELRAARVAAVDRRP